MIYSKCLLAQPGYKAHGVPHALRAPEKQLVLQFLQTCSDGWNPWQLQLRSQPSLCCPDAQEILHMSSVVTSLEVPESHPHSWH